MSNDASSDRANEALFYVGIGASAGGLEAFSTMVQNLSSDANAVYILAQHMSPTHKSLLTTLISRETLLPVEEIEDETVPKANTIFITPPNKDVVLKDGKLRLLPPSGHPASPKPSADRLFQSLAEEKGEQCVGVVLSGTGSDGSYGVQAIREAGGITIAQDPNSAKYDGMPTSAIDTGCIDLTLSAEQVGQHLTKILSSPRDFDQLRHLNDRPSKMADLFQILLARTQVDFRDYKENTVTRRINRRMVALEIADYDDYVALCRTSAQEVQALHRDLLISITRFFRDDTQFEQLRHEFSTMVADKSRGPFRLWIAGCASGEEVYSIAITLAEALGGLEHLKAAQVQIFATDIDDRALDVARRGSYPITAAADIPAPYVSTYFQERDGRIEVIPELRAITLFSKHNVFQDPPFLNVGFVSVRNVLIYFNPVLQNRVLQRIHYALSPEGLLFLGTSESVGNLESLFETRTGSEKIYAKRKVSIKKAPSFAMESRAFGHKTLPQSNGKSPTGGPPPLVENGLFDTLARSVAPNGFIVSRSGEMVRVFGNISHLIQLTENAPLWVSIRNLYKPLADEIQGLIATALRTGERRSGRWHDIDGREFNQTRSVCFPLPGTDQGDDTVLVALETRTKPAKLPHFEALTSDDQGAYIRRMEIEVAQTRDALQQTVEELQTTNEELQSINEEMQASNEELQATNEELETSNEELQSTNQELITVNEELQANSAELLRVSTELAATLEVVPFPVLVIDQALVVRRASLSAMHRFEIGALPKTGLHLSQCILPKNMTELASICNDVFRYREERRVIFNDERTVKQLSVTPFRNQTDEILGVVVTVINDISTGEAVDLLQRFGNIGHWQLDLRSNTLFWSDEVFRIHGLDPSSGVPSLEGAVDFYHPDDRTKVSDAMQSCIEAGTPFQFTLRLLRADGHVAIVEAAGTRFQGLNGQAMRVVGIFRNVTEQSRQHQLLDQMQVLQRDVGQAFYSYDLVNEVPFWSADLFTMLGLDPRHHSPSMKSATDIFHHDDRLHIRKQWDGAVATGAPFEIDARVVHTDGSIIICRGHGQTMRDENNVTTHMFGALAKITNE